MPVLSGNRLQETDGGQFACREGVGEIVQIVLMVGWTVMPDFGDRARAGMQRVYRRGVILKEGVVRDVVLGGPAIRCGRRARPSAAGGIVRVRERQVEAAHKGTPAYPLCVQQVADIGPAELYSGAGRTRIAFRIEIADQRSRAGIVRDDFG